MHFSDLSRIDARHIDREARVVRFFNAEISEIAEAATGGRPCGPCDPCVAKIRDERVGARSRYM